MAEENKHPPTTEEQAPPEMPGKAPKMERAEIPDVGAGPAPSAKVIDLSAVRSTPEKDAPTDIPKEPEAQPVSVTEQPPRYLVFFKGRDADALTAAFREFSAKKLTQEQKPSIRKVLVAFKEKAKELNANRQQTKHKGRGIDR